MHTEYFNTIVRNAVRTRQCSIKHGDINSKWDLIHKVATWEWWGDEQQPSTHSSAKPPIVHAHAAGAKSSLEPLCSLFSAKRLLPPNSSVQEKELCFCCCRTADPAGRSSVILCMPVLLCAEKEARKSAAGTSEKLEIHFFLVAHRPLRSIRKKRSRR